MLDLAIVIVNYNVRDLLRRCLQSVFATKGELSLTVCVVDNQSSDGSVDMVQSEFPQVELVANLENVGYPAANNQGMRRLGVLRSEPADRPRYVLLLNPDTVVPDDAFVTLLSYLDEQPKVAVLGPRLVLLDGKLDLACRRSFPTPSVSFYRMTGLSHLFPRSRRFGRYNLTFLDEHETAEVDSVVGAFMLVRTEAIRQVGLMDERFWMYGEDLDWAKRMKDKGWAVVYNPSVTVLHVKRASSRQNRRARVEFNRAMLIFYYKHYRRTTPFWLHWFVVAAIGIRGGKSVMTDVLAGPRILTTPAKA